jgi:hypothetical protein
MGIMIALPPEGNDRKMSHVPAVAVTLFQMVQKIFTNFSLSRDKKFFISL